MKIINNFRSFLLEDNFEIHIYKNKIDIIPYNIEEFITTISEKEQASGLLNKVVMQ